MPVLLSSPGRTFGGRTGRGTASETVELSRVIAMADAKRGRTGDHRKSRNQARRLHQASTGPTQPLTKISASLCNAPICGFYRRWNPDPFFLGISERSMGAGTNRVHSRRIRHLPHPIFERKKPV